MSGFEEMWRRAWSRLESLAGAENVSGKCKKKGVHYTKGYADGVTDALKTFLDDDRSIVYNGEKVFVEEVERGVRYDDCDKFSNGFIDSDGNICYEQKGAEDTFSIGMPVYSLDGVLLGRLTRGFYRHLDYTTKDGMGNNIPVPTWRVDGFKGEGSTDYKTYWQMLKERT